MSVYNESSMYNGQDPVDTSVYHDSTMSGNGSAADPLSVNFPDTNVAHDSTMSGNGSAADPLSVNFPATNVAHDSTMSGNGSAADPLSVNFPATNVAHDSTMSGDGSAADPLSVNFPATSMTVTNGTFKIGTLTSSSLGRYRGSIMVATTRDYQDDNNAFLIYIQRGSYAHGNDVTALATQIAARTPGVIRNESVSFHYVANADNTTDMYIKVDASQLVTLSLINNGDNGFVINANWSQSVSLPADAIEFVYDRYIKGLISNVGSVEQSVFVDSNGLVQTCPRNRLVSKSSSFNLNNEYTGSMIGETITVVNGINGDSGITVTYLDFNNRSRQCLITGGYCARFVCTDPSTNSWAADE